jgi:hypothetical protein
MTRFYHHSPVIKRLMCGVALGIVSEKDLLDAIEREFGERPGAIAVDRNSYTVLDHMRHGWPGQPLYTHSGWCSSGTEEERLVHEYVNACTSYVAAAGDPWREDKRGEVREKARKLFG